MTRVLLVLLIVAGLPSAHGQSPPTPLVQHGDTWHYRKGTSAPPADWHSVADATLDPTWLTGPGGFGYGDGDDGTTLGDMQGSYLTVHSRISFDVTAGMDPARHLRLTVDYDDGCIIYLDGQEVFRSSNVPGTPGTPYGFDQDLLTANHEASAGSGGSPAEVIDLGPLANLAGVGTHVLAAQGLNGTLNSTDLSLIVDLDIVDPPPPPVDITWSLADSPVTLGSDLVIDGGATLTIEAGVEVILDSAVSIQAVNGSHIDIAGTEAAPVVVRRSGGTDWGEISATGSGGSLTVRHADISGGQIRILSGVTGLVEDSTIHDAGAYAMIFSSDSPSVTLRRCAVSTYGETNFKTSLTILEDCLFEGATADAVDFDGATAGSTIRRCTFRNGPTGSNTDAIDLGPTGGVPSRDVVIEDCIMHNFSDKGVSIGDGPSDATGIIVRNCLMFNVSRGVQVKHGSVVTVHDCTIVDSAIGLHGFEKSGGTGGGIFSGCFNNILADDPAPIEIETNTTLEIDYSNTEGATWAGTGNIDADPLFRDASKRDYRLLAGSPCLGTGKFGDDMGVQFPVGGLPGVPTNLEVTSFDGNEAVLIWSDPDDLETEFVVEQSDDGHTWTPAAAAPANATGTTVSGLAGGPTWSFRVLGRNFIGDSFRSETATATASPADTDLDGMPDDYENMFAGLDPDNPDDANEDLDFDGSTNLQEFLTGTDPTDRTSVFRVQNVSESAPGTIRIHFTAQAAISYSVEFSDTLQPGSWQKLADVPAAPLLRPGQSVFDTPAPGTRFRVYRLVSPMQP